MEDSPPPLKSKGVLPVLKELCLNRGDPSSFNKLECENLKLLEQVKVLQNQLDMSKKSMQGEIDFLRIKLKESELKTKQLTEEIVVIKSVSCSQENLKELDEIFRLIAKDRKDIEREREILEDDRASFQREILSYKETIENPDIRKAVLEGSLQSANANIIAQRVREFLENVQTFDKKELGKIRIGMEEILAEKLKTLN
jgi:hypothetical protein